MFMFNDIHVKDIHVKKYLIFFNHGKILNIYVVIFYVEGILVKIKDSIGHKVGDRFSNFNKFISPSLITKYYYNT